MTKIYIGVICYLRKDFDWFISQDVIKSSDQVKYICILNVEDIRGMIFHSVFSLDRATLNPEYYKIMEFILNRIKN